MRCSEALVKEQQVTGRSLHQKSNHRFLDNGDTSFPWPEFVGHIDSAGVC